MTTEDKIKAVAAFAGLGGLLFGIVQLFQVLAIEAAKPYLEKKLAWCEEAVDRAARIATTEPPLPEDVQRFRQLYWGVMGLIENKDIEDTMDAFDQGIRDGIPAVLGSKLNGSDIVTLSKLSLDLAHACRAELAAEWSTSWTRQ